MANIELNRLVVTSYLLHATAKAARLSSEATRTSSPGTVITLSSLAVDSLLAPRTVNTVDGMIVDNCRPQQKPREHGLPQRAQEVLQQAQTAGPANRLKPHFLLVC